MSNRNTPQRNANGGKPNVIHRSPSNSRKPIPEIKVYVTKKDKDVLLGRGGESNGHPGNQRYLDEVKLLAPAYGKASKTEKTQISENVLQMVSQLGGRFIQKEKGTGTDRWFIAHENAARDKASQASSTTALREAYKKLQYQDAAAVGLEAASLEPESIASEAELAELCNRDRGNIFDDLDITSEGSQVLGSSASIDGSYDYRDETHQEYDNPYEGVVTKSPDGHVYENCKVAAKRAPPRDDRDEDDDDGPFAKV